MLTLRAQHTTATRSLGTATIENRAPMQRRVMQVLTIPLNQADAFSIGEPVTVLDSGTGQAERCQVESWAIPYPNGGERIIRLHYPAVLPANSLRISHEFERSAAGALPAFEHYALTLKALEQMRVVFFCGPKATHWCNVLWPGAVPLVVLDGPRCKVHRYFARVYEPSHAPTLRTQFWAEVDLHLYHDENYALAYFRWGIDDSRIDAAFESRTGLSEEESEVGFDVMGVNDYRAARPQPLLTASNVHTLDGSQQGSEWRWRWVWDRKTLSTRAVWLNERYPWGVGLGAKVALTFSLGELDPLRVASAEAWHALPVYHPGISDEWMEKGEAWAPWGAIPRRNKAHEHFGTVSRDAEYVRGRLEIEAWTEATVPANRDIDGNIYAWHHYPSAAIGRVWHETDGQQGGIHEYWNKNPHIAAAQYRVPGLAHYAERALLICPWPYFGFREVDGRILSCLDHPAMGNNRGWPSRDGDLYGKVTDPGTNPPRLLHPFSGTRLLGADVNHFETGWPFMHAALFGDDGARRQAEQMTFGPVHMGNYTEARGRGSVSEQRGWARGTTMWAWVLWLLGGDRRLVDKCADGWLAWRVQVAMDNTDAEFAGRIVQAVYFHSPGTPSQSFVGLNNYRYFRPWEIGHAAGERAIADLAAHIRPELEFFRQHADDNARDIFRYGEPRIVDETTGQIEYTFRIPAGGSGDGELHVCGAAAIVDGATRQQTQAEMFLNNWTLCAGPSPPRSECGTSPTNDGYMRLGGGTAWQFCAGVGWLVLDGPIGLGDLVLHRYVDATERSRRHTMQSPVNGSYLYWLDKDTYKWAAGRFDDVHEGTAAIRGAYAVPTTRCVAIARAVADRIWTSRTNDVTLRRYIYSTGALGLTVVPGGTAPVFDEWSGIASARIGGEDVLVLLDGLDPSPNRTSYGVTIVEEATPENLVEEWTFAFADGISRSASGIAWAPQLGGLLIGANRAGEAPSMWFLGVGGSVAARISLPMAPTSEGRIVLDVAVLHCLACSDDGRLLVVTDLATGARHYYIWNGYTGVFGVPRLKKAGHALVTLTPHVREDDALRLVEVHDLNFREVPV